MKKIGLVLLASVTFGLTTNAQPLEWAKSMGGTFHDHGQDIVSDAAGNVYTTGYFNGPADFDPNAGSEILSSLNGDIFIQKLDPLGNLVWAKGIGVINQDIGRSITLDPSGNVLITGSYLGTADFDPGPCISYLYAPGLSYNTFVLKLDASGNFLWAKNMNASSTTITTDASGNVYTAGNFSGIVDFDPNAGVLNLTSSGPGNRAFVQKLDPSGNFISAIAGQGAGAGSIDDIAINNAGDLCVVGTFKGIVDFDPSVGVSNLSAITSDIYIMELSSTLSFNWVKQMPGSTSGLRKANAIETDALNNIYICGMFSSTIDMDPGAGTVNLSSSGGFDAFFAKYDVSGNLLWGKGFGGSGREEAKSIGIHPNGNVYVIGDFENTVDFDPTSGVSNSSSSGSTDVFISSFNSAGGFIEAKIMGGVGIDLGEGIDINGLGDVYSTGMFYNTVDFDPEASTSYLSSLGYSDIFVQKLGLPQVNPNDTKCMSFDGTDDYLTSQTNALNNIGTGNFTFEATVNGIEADQGSHPMIFANGAISLFFHNIWGTATTKMLCLKIGGSNYFLIDNGTFNANILDGECHHVAVVRKGTKLKFFIDGQLVGTRIIPANVSVSGGTLNIGKYSSNNYFFEGSISQLRIWNKVRGSSVISANMNTPIPVQSGLKAYFELNDGNGQIADNKVDNFDAELGSTATIDANDPSWGANCCVVAPPPACISFDGTDDYLTSQTIALNNIGTGNFTFEATVNGIEADQGSHPMIFANGAISLFFHNIWGTATTKMLCLKIGGSNYFLIDNGTFNANILDGECHHVAVVRKGTKLKFFIDGQLVGTRIIPANVSVSGGTLNIGKYSSNNYFFEGNISQLRIWNKTRGSSALSANMNTSIPVQSGLKAYFELNDGNGQIADNKVDNYDAQLGSTANIDANDPSWTQDCCDMQVARIQNNDTSNEETEQFSPNSVEQDITIYPNPNNGVFEVSFKGIEEEVTVEIYNSIGKLIESKQVLNPQHLNVDLTQYSKGLYLIKVATAEQVISKHVIVQ